MTQWQPVVDTGCDLPDQSGSEHQLVTDNLCVGWGFFKGRNQKLGSSHGCCIARGDVNR